MLIKCPECKKEISDKAKICIHCGYPIEDYKEDQVRDTHDVAKFTKIKSYEQQAADFDYSSLCPVCKGVNWYNNLLEERILCQICGYVAIDNVCQHNKYMTSEAPTQQISNQPKCPKCGCTNIQVVRRKFSLLTGFATNKTDRVCANCNYKW